MKCANCGNTTFYKMEYTGHFFKGKSAHRLANEKYICTKCGYKGTTEMHKKYS